MVDQVVRRPFGFASAIVSEARTLTVSGDVSPLVAEVLRDQLQLARDEIREAYLPLTQTDTIWLANVIKTSREVRFTWWQVWEETPLSLLPLACMDYAKHVDRWHTDALAAVETLWRFAAPIALKVSIEAAPQFGSWREAMSFVSANGLEVIRRWRPTGGITFLKYFEEATRGDLHKGLALLRGRGQQLDQRLRTIWAARASLLAYGVDQAMITPELVHREIAVQYAARDEALPAFWTLELVTELLVSQQYAPMWSLDYRGDALDRAYGETITGTTDLEEHFERNVMLADARQTARALAKAGLWDVAMSLPLGELHHAASQGTAPLTHFCDEWRLEMDDALAIISTTGHLTLWCD